MINPIAIDERTFIRIESSESEQSCLIRKTLVSKITRTHGTVKVEGAVGDVLTTLLEAHFENLNTAIKFTNILIVQLNPKPLP